MTGPMVLALGRRRGALFEGVAITDPRVEVASLAESGSKGLVSLWRNTEINVAPAGREEDAELLALGVVGMGANHRGGHGPLNAPKRSKVPVSRLASARRPGGDSPARG